jgi:hypothetical protein
MEENSEMFPKTCECIPKLVIKDLICNHLTMLAEKLDKLFPVSKYRNMI